MCFYWKSLQRQVHIEGDVSRVSDAESDTYFATRPRASQLGAWASLQSRPLESRALFEERIAQYDKTYQDQAVPRPPHWGGYRLSPSIFEFWQEQLYRWHDRLSYRRNGEAWEIERLYP